MTEVAIVATGTANLASVRAAIARLGGTTEVTQSPATVDLASHLILPGVGAFGAAVETLRSQELFVALQQRLRAKKPTLAICLGFQLLCQGSDESPGLSGLGVIKSSVEHIGPDVRTPQLGWNKVSAEDPPFVPPGYAYFANSFCLRQAPTGWQAAWTEHGGPMVAAVCQGVVWGCQFHPELSGPWGEALLRQWLQGGVSC